MQLQEDLRKQLNEDGQYTEEELEEYMQTHKKLMVDSLWKLNVADIEATLSNVCQMVFFLDILVSFDEASFFCFIQSFVFVVWYAQLQVLQDNAMKKEDLRARAKGLKTLGKIFQVICWISLSSWWFL